MMWGLRRNHLPPVRRSTVNQDVMRCPEPAFIRAQRGGPPVRQTPDPEALKKITALESELLKLRAQIALIVTAAPASGTQYVCLCPIFQDAFIFSEHQPSVSFFFLVLSFIVF